MVKKVCPQRVDVAEGLANPRVEKRGALLQRRPHQAPRPRPPAPPADRRGHRQHSRAGGAVPQPAWMCGPSPPPCSGGRVPATLTTSGEHARVRRSSRCKDAPSRCRVSCGDAATQAPAAARAPSIIGPTGDSADRRRRGGSPSWWVASPRLSRQSTAYDANSDRSLARAGHRGRRSVERHLPPTVRHVRQRPAHPDPPGLAGRARRRGPPDQRRVGAGSARGRVDPRSAAWRPGWPPSFADRAQGP